MTSLRLALLGGLTPLLGGCLYATGGVETFEYRVEPQLVASIAPAEGSPAEARLSPTEIRYARDTARTVFRRRPAERSEGFVATEGGGFALCLRAGADYALLVFERRVFEDAISQAADDARILRGAKDTAVCRERGRRWVAV